MAAADAFDSTTSPKVKCEVTLIKPTENYAKLEEDYGLSKVNIFQNCLRFFSDKLSFQLCEKPVEVLTVEGNHRSFLVEENSLQTIQKVVNQLAV